MPRPESVAGPLRAQLADIDIERTEIHDQIAGLRSHLEALAEKRKEVTQQLEKITFPILTIPPEITGYIFSYYAEYMVDEYDEYSPFILTHVCRLWREIALSIPKLWAKINMDGMTSSPSSELMLRRWFERAGTSSLEVHAPSGFKLGVGRLFSMLTIYSDQIVSLTCTVPLPQNCPLDGISGRLSRMTHLSLFVTGQSTPITIFSDAPALRRLELVFGESPGRVDLPWEQLVEVSICGFNPNILDSIAKMSRIEALTIPRAEYIRTANTLMMLSHLKTLDCSLVLRSSGSAEFLRSFNCPHLETFRIDFHKLEATADAVHHFLHHNNSSLRHLKLNNAEIQAALKVFQYTPMIEQLSITNAKHIEELWYPLTYTPPKILPALRKLEIHAAYNYMPHDDIASLVHIRSRSLDYANMQHVFFDMPSEGRDSMRQMRLAVQTEGGMIDGCQVKLSGLADPTAELSLGKIPLYSLADVDDGL
ncbi:F-box domain-containing protein [Mycena indigotica]|uniref:F-box domain-containing protein n=1 Tax=Mycena indigotica TaxID=2126181 RepID=A0A8H6SVP6_9AGAR|nr:F-box domain-containing protein [Mycena indigotica]KAF7306244.1 F-box domain-containing protein [Mycena indigotica]